MTEPVLTESPASCVSCGAARLGPYCSACGQKERGHRLTLWSVAREAFQHLTSFDKGFGHTVVELLRRPAGVAQDYWNGRTAPYAGPGRFFLVVVTVVQIAFFAFGSAAETAESFSDGFTGGQEMAPGDAPALDAATALERIRRFWVVGLAGLVPVLTLASRALFRRAGRTLAEHAVANLYFFGMFVVCMGVSRIAGGAIYDHVSEFAGNAFEILTFVGAFGLYTWSLARSLGTKRWTAFVRAFVVLMLGIVSYIAVTAFITGALSAHSG